LSHAIPRPGKTSPGTPDVPDFKVVKITKIIIITIVIIYLAGARTRGAWEG